MGESVPVGRLCVFIGVLTYKVCSGVASPPPPKTLCLIHLTLAVVRVAYVPVLALQLLVGSWIFVLMFRRPLFARVFHIVPGD